MSKYIEVKVPEPISPVELYNVQIKDKQFNHDKLSNLLTKVERDLDDICGNRLNGNEISIVCYNMIMQKHNTSEYIGNLMEGGFDLSVEDGRKYSLPDFQERYKNSFRAALEEIGPHRLDLDLEFIVVSYIDKIVTKTKAFFPGI